VTDILPKGVTNNNNDGTKHVKENVVIGSKDPLWNQIPFYGKEALISTIDDEKELIAALQAEDKNVYNNFQPYSGQRKQSVYIEQKLRRILDYSDP
jgi:hypothetical protein